MKKASGVHKPPEGEEGGNTVTRAQSWNGGGMHLGDMEYFEISRFTIYFFILFTILVMLVFLFFKFKLRDHFKGSGNLCRCFELIS